mgnify:FL=1
MKKALGSIAALIIFVFLCTSGLFDGITNFFVWLVTLNMTQSSVSTVGEIFVKVATFAITYTVVGIIFNAIGWFDSDAMKIVYFIISTLISFALCYVVMIFETHLLLLSIIFGVILAAVIAFFIITGIRSREK